VPESRLLSTLEQAFLRKEKALAETAALLVLRGRIEAFWGVEGDGTKPRRESVSLSVDNAIDWAVSAGAGCRAPAKSPCEELGLSARTIQRWRAQGGACDLRVGGVSPANKLSDEEWALVLATANSAEFRDVAPKQAVSVLADRTK
jgi:hypothetical protein